MREARFQSRRFVFTRSWRSFSRVCSAGFSAALDIAWAGRAAGTLARLRQSFGTHRSIDRHVSSRHA